jgi:hypothetical protein
MRTVYADDMRTVHADVVRCSSECMLYLLRENRRISSLIIGDLTDCDE